jgi:hypothetical protein
VQRATRRALRERLPLHLSMTEATCARFGTLKERYSTTLATLRGSSGATLMGTAGAATMAATAGAAGQGMPGGWCRPLQGCCGLCACCIRLVLLYVFVEAVHMLC